MVEGLLYVILMLIRAKSYIRLSIANSKVGFTAL